jgi:Nitrile hydratase, alpha chain
MAANSALAKVGERARTDASFKEELLSDPIGVLATAGVQVPKGVNIKVVENTPTLVHLVLPSLPQGQLSEQDLKAVAGGLQTSLTSQTSLNSQSSLGSVSLHPFGDSYILW